MPTVSTRALLGAGVSLSGSYCPMTWPPVLSEGFSDSDEVFPKEMTKWNSSDFIDAFASPVEAEGPPGKDCRPPAQPPVQGALGTTQPSAYWGPKLSANPERVCVELAGERWAGERG